MQVATNDEDNAVVGGRIVGGGIPSASFELLGAGKGILGVFSETSSSLRLRRGSHHPAAPSTPLCVVCLYVL